MIPLVLVEPEDTDQMFLGSLLGAVLLLSLLLRLSLVVLIRLRLALVRLALQVREQRGPTVPRVFSAVLFLPVEVAVAHPQVNLARQAVLAVEVIKTTRLEVLGQLTRVLRVGQVMTRETRVAVEVEPERLEILTG